MNKKKLTAAAVAIVECFPEGAYSLQVEVDVNRVQVTMIAPDGLGGYSGVAPHDDPGKAVDEMLVKMERETQRIKDRASKLGTIYAPGTK